MNKMMQTIDAILNRHTMYRVVLYGLIALLVIADVLAFTGVLSISATGLLISTGLLIASFYAANRLFAWLFRAPYNTESWLISALILACILPPAQTFSRALLVVLCGTIAMASKYVLVHRGSHIFNPAAIAAFVMSVTGLLPATWWIATPSLLPFTALLALIVLRKQRKFSLFFAFALSAALLIVYIGSVFNGEAALSVLHNAFLSWPIVFMGSIMLTEPSTLPPTKYYQLLFGVLVGVVFASQLHVGAVTATPQTALLIGNLFTLAFVPAIGAMVRLKEIVTLGPNLYGLSFERPKGLDFAAGQYLEWTLPHSGVDSRGNRRMFSIASSLTEPDLQIGIKTYEPSSSFKKALLALRPGAPIRVAHVAGNFTLPVDTAMPLVFIAGGIGITPFRSMLRYLVDTKQRRDVSLFYIAAKQEDFVYEQDLQAAEAIGIKRQYIIGKMEETALQEALPQFKRSLIYISGPDAFVSHYKQTMIGLGVSRTRVKTDHFTGY